MSKLGQTDSLSRFNTLYFPLLAKPIRFSVVYFQGNVTVLLTQTFQAACNSVDRFMFTCEMCEMSESPTCHTCIVHHI